MLFNKTRQYNMQIFNKIIFFKFRTRQLKAMEISKLCILVKLPFQLLISFCRFDLSCPILEKDIFIKKLYIVLFCLF